MLDPADPCAGDDPTAVAADRIETVDALGATARAARDRGLERDMQRAQLARLARDTGTAREAIEIGRYQLLEIAGTGGMGMVWSAWDPELERRVAIKLVRLSSRASRDRMLREGKVLARLSHPNIVPIYDVGAAGEQVYLVMEWVRGTTLRAYAATRPGWGAIADAYRQAATGLDAAHRAGVIHRDFKPDNAIRGDDGRVRVLDFGLAHTDDTGDPQRVAGTPRYMAPEQTRGEPLSAAVDQFALGVSLREALAGGDPPAWLLAIAERGAAAGPADRFPSMAALLVALDRDRSRRWRRTAIAGAIAAAAAGAFAIGKAGAPAVGAVEPCAGAASEIAAAWNPALRDRTVAHLRALGPLGEGEALRLAGELDRHATAWAGAHRAACLAYARHELTPPRYEARLGCLVRTRAQLAATGELVSTVDAVGLGAALVAARSLPDAAGCAESEAVVPPPAAVSARVAAVVPRIERALVRASARSSDALADAAAATAEARATGYTPVIARALLVEGRAAMVIGGGVTRARLAEATTIALRASDDALAVEAYARWMFELARSGETEIDGWPMMQAVAERLGPGGRFARALLYNNRGVARLIANDRTGAREMFERARAIAGDAPEIELVVIQRNLANLEATPDASERLARQALERHVAVLGADHPETHIARFARALVIRERARARAELATACEGLARWRQGSAAAECAYEAAWLADADGDTADAARWMAQIPPSETLQGHVVAAYLALGSDAAPTPRIAADLSRRAAAKDLALWQLLAASDALVLAARASEQPAARRSWLGVAALLERLDLVPYHRRLARAHQVLAEHPGTPPAEAATHAAWALAWFRGVPGDEAITARLERITDPSSR